MHFILKNMIILCLVILARALLGDLVDFKQFMGLCTLIAAGCISFKMDWNRLYINYGRILI